MNFTVPENYTREELLITNSPTISETRSEEASYTSHAGVLWTTETMAVLVPIVTESLWEQSITAGLLILF